MDRLWLLEDLLEHEMLEAAPLGILEGPRHPLGLARDRAPIVVDDPDGFGRDYDDFSVHHVKDSIRVFEERRDVRREVVLVRAQANYEGTEVAGGDDFVRLLRRDGQDRIRAGKARQGGSQGVLEVPFVVLFDQVDDGLRVRLGEKRVASALQLVPKGREVLDDPVVCEGDSAVAIIERMGVLLARRPVGGPPGVPDSRHARPFREPGLEVRDVPFVLCDLDPVLEDGDARAVVSAVLEAVERVEEDGKRRTVTRVADDAAHLTSRLCRSERSRAPGSAARSDSARRRCSPVR